jgi:hypothetical protein
MLFGAQNMMFCAPNRIFAVMPLFPAFGFRGEMAMATIPLSFVVFWIVVLDGQ